MSCGFASWSSEQLLVSGRGSGLPRPAPPHGRVLPGAQSRESSTGPAPLSGPQHRPVLLPFPQASWGAAGPPHWGEPSASLSPPVRTPMSLDPASQTPRSLTRRPWAAARTCKALFVYEAKPERTPTSPPLTRCHTGLSASPLLLCYPHPTWDPAAPPTAHRSIRAVAAHTQSADVVHCPPPPPVTPCPPQPPGRAPSDPTRFPGGRPGRRGRRLPRASGRRRPGRVPHGRVPHGALARGPVRGRPRQGSRGCREAPRCASTARRLIDFYHCVVPHRPGGPQLPTQPPKGVWVASGPWPSRAKPRCSFADRLCVDRSFQIS